MTRFQAEELKGPSLYFKGSLKVPCRGWIKKNQNIKTGSSEAARRKLIAGSETWCQTGAEMVKMKRGREIHVTFGS